MKKDNNDDVSHNANNSNDERTIDSSSSANAGMTDNTSRSSLEASTSNIASSSSTNIPRITASATDHDAQGEEQFGCRGSGGGGRTNGVIDWTASQSTSLNPTSSNALWKDVSASTTTSTSLDSVLQILEEVEMILREDEDEFDF